MKDDRQMTTHYMHLVAHSFENIISGRQTLETRLCDEKRRDVRVGDCIVFANLADAEQECTAEVRALFIYHTFRELFEDFNRPPHYATAFTPEEGARVMRNYYSEEDERRYGVIGIRIRLVP